MTFIHAALFWTQSLVYCCHLVRVSMKICQPIFLPHSLPQELFEDCVRLSKPFSNAKLSRHLQP